MIYYDNRKLEFPCQFGQSIFNYSMASVTTDYRFSSNVGIDSFFGLFSTVHFPMCTQVVCIRRRIITLVTTDYKFSSNAGIDALPKSTQNNYRPSSVVFLLLSVLDQKEIKITTNLLSLLLDAIVWDWRLLSHLRALDVFLLLFEDTQIYSYHFFPGSTAARRHMIRLQASAIKMADGSFFQDLTMKT